jgi:hypothetical protein
MKWLARLKKTEIVPKVEATEPTKPSQESETGGFVGFVAPVLAPVRKTGGDSPAANDPDHKVTARVTTETDGKVQARFETGQDTKVIQRFEKTSDPDRDSWPHSDAMNGGEIDTFTARLIRFTDKGLALDDSEALADQLVRRDRELDDRRLCLECSQLAGHAGSWRCRGWQRAGIARQARDAGLPGELVRTLQRCDGFTATH